MPNPMQTAAAWLGDQLKDSAGIAVVIQQGDTTLTGITGWVSKQEYVVVDSEGFSTSVTSHDWAFTASDLPSDFEFMTGTVIRATINATEMTYEALPMANKACVENLDSSGVLLTVHAKRVQ